MLCPWGGETRAIRFDSKYNGGVNILVAHFSAVWLVSVYLLFAVVLALAIYHAPWYHLREADSLNAFLGAIIGIATIWTLKAGFADGLDIHLLGAALLTLMFGWAFAILSLLMIWGAHTYLFDGSWLALPVNVLVVGVVPVLISYTIHRLADRYLPNNYFVYIFVGAFFGAAIAIAASVFTSSLLHWLSGTYTWEFVWINYTRYVPMMMLPEAFLTGGLMTLFVVYRPQWVSSFDDSRYLDNN